MYYVYVLRCKDGSLYCGSTADYKRRISEHFLKLPAAAKYTKSHPVEEVEAVWSANDKTAAMKLEYHFKRLPRKEKLLLIKEPGNIAKYIPKLSGLGFSVVQNVKIENCLK